MITPEQVGEFLAHSPLRFGLAHCCENTEHVCNPETCKRECWRDAAADLARWINESATGKGEIEVIRKVR